MFGDINLMVSSFFVFRLVWIMMDQKAIIVQFPSNLEKEKWEFKLGFTVNNKSITASVSTQLQVEGMNANTIKSGITIARIEWSSSSRIGKGCKDSMDTHSSHSPPSSHASFSAIEARTIDCFCYCFPNRHAAFRIWILPIRAVFFPYSRRSTPTVMFLSLFYVILISRAQLFIKWKGEIYRSNQSHFLELPVSLAIRSYCPFNPTRFTIYLLV